MNKDYEETLESINAQIRNVEDILLKSRDDEERNRAMNDYNKLTDLKIKLMESQEKIENDKRKIENENKNRKEENVIKKKESNANTKKAVIEVLLAIGTAVGSFALQNWTVKKTFDFDEQGKMLTSTAGKSSVQNMIGKIFKKK